MSVKRNIRIEVGDVDNVLGVCQTESVQVIGEAYDVALDMSFPRGADGGLDFGVVRVFDDSKLGFPNILKILTCRLSGNYGLFLGFLQISFIILILLKNFNDNFRNFS